MADYKIDGKYLKDRHGSKIGEFDGRCFKDMTGKKVGSIDHEFVKDDGGRKVAEIDVDIIKIRNKKYDFDDLRRKIYGDGIMSLIGFYALFVDEK
ncbi:MAG: hypothetical protein AB7T10_04700 [bacterium]